MKPGIYQGLIRVENPWTRSIEIDIPRTFPESPCFSKDYQQQLLRVLHAYANLNREVGYCQGMNFVAGLLLRISRNEEESFWMLVCLMDTGKLSGFYQNNFPLLRRYLKAYDDLVQEMVPDLREHFKREHVQPAVYLHQWFLTLFINALPLPMVLAFWDVIVCIGLEELLPITIALLRVLKNMLLGLEFEEIIRYFKLMRSGIDESIDMSVVGHMIVAQSSEILVPPPVADILNPDNEFEDVDSPPALGKDRDSVFGTYLKSLNDTATSWWEDAQANLQKISTG